MRRRFSLAPHCFFLAISAVLLSQPVHAETASTSTALAAARVGLTLGQAVQRFRSQSLKLVAGRYEVSSARAEIIAAGLLPNPNLSLNASFQLHGEPDSADRQYSVLLSQGLPLWGRLAASKDAAQLSASASERQFAAVSWELLSELRGAYLSLQLAEARRVVLSAGLTDLERVQGVLEARTAAGANPAYDRVRLEVERGSLRARVAQAEVDVALAGSDLAASIGGTPDALELSATEPLPEPVSDVRQTAALVKWALEHRQEVAASHFEAGAAEARLRAARRRFIPEPELGLGYAHWTGIPGSGGSGGALLAAASIPLPIFDHGQGTIDRQLEQSRAARVRELDSKNGVQREVERAARSVQLTTAAYRAYREEASHNAETVRRIAEVTYREGRGTILELLDAYSSYLRVEEQALELRGSALLAVAALESALGPQTAR